MAIPPKLWQPAIRGYAVSPEIVYHRGRQTVPSGPSLWNTNTRYEPPKNQRYNVPLRQNVADPPPEMVRNNGPPSRLNPAGVQCPKTNRYL